MSDRTLKFFRQNIIVVELYIALVQKKVPLSAFSSFTISRSSSNWGGQNGLAVAKLMLTGGLCSNTSKIYIIKHMS